MSCLTVNGTVPDYEISDRYRYTYIKVTGCLYVCLSILYLRILLTAEPKWFSFTIQLLVGPGKVYIHFNNKYFYVIRKYIYWRDFRFLFSFS